MKRLRSAPPRLGAPASRLGSMATAGSGFARSDGRSSTERGYGADWRKARAQVLREEPTCRFCGTRRSAEVDHIVRFHGVEDPLRLARSNLRALCVPCHRSRTARQSHCREG